MKILITGCAGFIGYHLAAKLLGDKHYVYGLDSLNDYYDKSLKIDRLKLLRKKKNFSFRKIDISKYRLLDTIFKKNKFEVVINLAAYAGVGYSMKHPEKYIYTNEIGFFNILELSRKYKIKKLLYASSSSIYGANKLPFRETQNTDSPLSLYGATKKNNEILAYYYSNQFKLPTFGIRFFTVYGPYGRPDLSIFKFCNQILKNKTITLYNYGNNFRDFTYIDDLIDSLNKIIKLKLSKIKKKKNYYLINISSGKKIKISKLVKLIEKTLGKKSKIRLVDKLTYDIPASLSYSKVLKNIIKVKKSTDIRIGIKKFTNWFQEYYY